jgi:hypothetical protein
MRRNPYKKITEEEKLKKEAQQREIEAKIKGTAKLGRECLSDDKFKKYRDSYIQSREMIISLMKQNNESDPIKFAFFCKACLSKLDGMDMLLDLVDKDAKRRR